MNSVDERRVRLLNNSSVTTEGPVMYVMAREQRVANNWALLFAQQKAESLGVPLIVLFAIGPMFLQGTARHNYWLIESLKCVEKKLKKLKIPLFVVAGDWVKVVCAFQKQHDATCVVFDQNPLQPVNSWRQDAARQLPVTVFEVDARNVVPVWEASDKQEFAAYTIRPKIHRKLSEFLTEFPNLKKQKLDYTSEIINWDTLSAFRSSKSETSVPTWLVPGEDTARKILKDFISKKLSGYAEGRNDPNQDYLSNLSPYLRWGNISAQHVALAIKAVKGLSRGDKEVFLEELIVRRELADNFVFYNDKYNKVEGAHDWAQTTIKLHSKDKREYVYTYEELERGETHDDLWNAAQMQMVETGKMHGYLRMYWAKKILEWTPSAQVAIDYALKLNDTYELDGRDSNGVVGVMWSICGVHDRAWAERPVFGKVRYMNYNGAKRKFDVDAYIERYLGSKDLFNEQ